MAPISVGKWTTMPVPTNSAVTHPHNMMPMMPMIRPRVPKNGSGLYSRIMRKMVLITLMPSPTVSSLDTATFRPVAVLDGHFEQTQVVVQRVDGHLRLDLEAARKHGVGFDEREAERAVSGHDVGDVRAEQVVDGAAHETVAEIVERALILLEVCGGEAVADCRCRSLRAPWRPCRARRRRDRCRRRRPSRTRPRRCFRTWSG